MIEQHIERIINVFVDNKNMSLSIYGLYPRISSIWEKGMYDITNEIHDYIKNNKKSIMAIQMNYNTGNLEYRLKDDFYKNELRKIKLNKINENTRK